MVYIFATWSAQVAYASTVRSKFDRLAAPQPTFGCIRPVIFNHTHSPRQGMDPSHRIRTHVLTRGCLVDLYRGGVCSCVTLCTIMGRRRSVVDDRSLAVATQDPPPEHNSFVRRRVTNFPTIRCPLRSDIRKIGTIQRRLAWPLHKDDTLFQSGRSSDLNIYFASTSYHHSPDDLVMDN